MRNIKITILISVVIILALVSCNNKEIPGIKYSFFVAGHTYGNPTKPQYGLYPEFKNAIPTINNYNKMALGVLVGDVVAKPKKDYWDSAMVDIDKFKMPIHVSAGNHDIGPAFTEIFKKYYYQFKYEDDLFIILTPNKWNIDGKRKEFLTKTLEDNYKDVDNIFIFCHELIWWSPDSIFGNVEINYRPHYPGSTNYWAEINPMLDTLPNNVVIFAGDLGCTAQVSSYMYYNYGNITLIGTGMGGGKVDNFVIVEVDNNNNINYKLIGLNKTPYSEMAKLEDYILP